MQNHTSRGLTIFKCMDICKWYKRHPGHLAIHVKNTFTSHQQTSGAAVLHGHNVFGMTESGYLQHENQVQRKTSEKNVTHYLDPCFWIFVF